MHEVRVPLNAVRLGVRAISDYVGYSQAPSSSDNADDSSPVQAFSDGLRADAGAFVSQGLGGGLLQPQMRSAPPSGSTGGATQGRRDDRDRADYVRMHEEEDRLLERIGLGGVFGPVDRLEKGSGS